MSIPTACLIPASLIFRGELPRLRSSPSYRGLCRGQAGSCFYFMGGFEKGNVLDFVNDIGYYKQEQLSEVTDA